MDVLWDTNVAIPLFILLATSAYLYSKWRHSYWKRKNVCQLDPVIFYGDTKEMVQGKKSLTESYYDFYKKFKSMGVKYGGTYTLYTKVFVPVHPEIVKDVMQKNFDHFNAHFPQRDTGSIFSKNLFALTEDQWRITRKKLTPTFTSGKMKMMFETLWEKTRGLNKVAGEIAESKQAAHIKDVLERFTIDVIGSCGFGVECNAIKNPDAEFVRFGKLIFKPQKNNFILEALRQLGLMNRRNNITEAEDFFKDLVSNTIDYREKNKQYRKDFMHLMIQLKNMGIVTDDEEIFSKTHNQHDTSTYSIDWITAQCLLFFAAGFETSATTMTFALLELAQNQDIQEKVREEANLIFNKYNGKMNYEAMMELTYTEKVIQETLRKYPPLAAIPRTCTTDYTIPGTDIVIEKGTATFIPARGLQMDPEYFPDPEKFDPERFNEENKKKIKDFTYIPFGEGPRMCLGLRFGMMQSKTGLMSLVKDYKFTLGPKTKFPLKMSPTNVISGVDGDVWLNIEKV